MRGSNLDSSWNSERPVEVTPEEYERQAFAWLRASEGEPTEGMVFSTGGFQRGPIEYASQNGVALLNFRDGRATYETRNDGHSSSRHLGWTCPASVPNA